MHLSQPDAISDRTLQQVLTAAVKVYAAKVERRGHDVPPFAQGAVTATESVVTATSQADQSKSATATVVVDPVAVTTRVALSSDNQQSILLTNSDGTNYVLPQAVLAPANRWCAFVMGTGVGVYHITVGGTAQVNGQTAPLRLSRWQMARVCQDSAGHYWTNLAPQ